MKPTNTAKRAHDDPLTTLLMTMGSGGIERQEARGQQELVNSASLPTECRGREALEVAGVKFGQPYKDDPLFCDAVLPKGWKKRATDHSMWSELVDAKGRVRARIFYKAAHYDRRADMSVERRFNFSAYHDGKDKDHYACIVTDGGKPVHTVGEVRCGSHNDLDAIEKEAEAWLEKKYPDWKSAAAYWD